MLYWNVEAKCKCEELTPAALCLESFAPLAHFAVHQIMWNVSGSRDPNELQWDKEVQGSLHIQNSIYHLISSITAEDMVGYTAERQMMTRQKTAPVTKPQDPIFVAFLKNKP